MGCALWLRPLSIPHLPAHIFNMTWCWISSCLTPLQKPFVFCVFGGGGVIYNLFLVRFADFLVGSIFHVFTFKFKWLGLITLMTWSCTTIIKMDQTFFFVSCNAWVGILRLSEQQFYIKHSWRTAAHCLSQKNEMKIICRFFFKTTRQEHTSITFDRKMQTVDKPKKLLRNKMNTDKQ